MSFVPTAVLVSTCALAAASCDREEPERSLGELRGAPIDAGPAPAPTPGPDSTAGTLPAPPPAVAAMTGVALASEAPPVDPPELVDGYQEVRFDLLTSFEYEWSPTTGISSDGALERIPAEVRKLGGTKVLIRGYMQPIEFDRDGVRAFLLTNIPGGCCFGMVPRLNEWIEVTLPG